MPTVADITRRAVKEIADLVVATSTEGTASTLKDAATLNQKAGHWDEGVYWILSGTHAGKAERITAFLGGQITFAALASNPHPCRFAVARRLFPWSELVKAVQTALETDGAEVTTLNNALTGDGSTLEHTLPAGVFGVRHVYFKDTSTPARVVPSFHWRERNGKLIFELGHAPPDNHTIQLEYPDKHTEVTAATDTIDDELNDDWLVWKTVENLLRYGLRLRGDNPARDYANTLQFAMERLQKLRPLRRLFDVVEQHA